VGRLRREMARIGNETKLIIKLAKERIAKLRPIRSKLDAQYTTFNGRVFEKERGEGYESGFFDAREEVLNIFYSIINELEV
jgi:hypothetical protein